MKRRGTVAGLAAVVCLVMGGGSVANAQPLPVPYGNREMVRVATEDWNGAVPGANDYSCTPSPRHPKPVVLVNSTFLTDAVNWTALAPYLHNQGYCVFTFNYGRDIYDVGPGITGLDPIPSSAPKLSEIVDKVRSATGVSKVDLVAHSQGGVLARYYLNKLGGAAKVDRTVMLSSPYSLTGLPVDVGQIARDVIPRDLYDAILYNGKVPPIGLNLVDPWAFGDAQPLQPNVDYTVITDFADELGLYGGMHAPAGATNARTQYIDQVCPTDFSQHFAQPYSPTAVAMVGNALDPAHPVAPPCTVVPLYSFG